MATGIIEAVIAELAGAVVGKLGEIAVEQVANQASLLLHFRKDFEWLKEELTKVRGYLQYEHDQKEPVKKWFADLQDIALDAEDLVQECAVQPLYGGDSWRFRYTMGKRIRKLKGRMKSIMKDLKNLKLIQEVSQVRQTLISDGRVEEWKKSGLVERDARPVAIDAKVEKILHFLEDDAVQVVAVLGMGGIGKTFLLQNVYNNNRARRRFQKLIWLSISQVYSVARLQYDIASHFDKDLSDKVKADGVSVEKAAEFINEKLNGESCLIVLDDVWRVKGVDNLMQRLGFPGGTSNPCKVVVTTRSKEVCDRMGASQIYRMELLSDQDSWNLFCLHAFPDSQQNRPPQELDEVAHKVEKKCHSLPLAIKTVASSMAGEKELSSWNSQLLQLEKVSHLQDPIEPILRLSYDALPAVLKPCFLYVAFFGEDVEIDAEYLIYLWIAEGFIPQDKEQWSTGWKYLKQLHNLCLVEVSEDEELKKTCKVHDLILDLTKSISKENKCAFTVEEASAVGCRRVLLAKGGLNWDYRDIEFPKSVRTLSLSQNRAVKLPTKSFKGVGAVRVIDSSDTNIQLLPSIRNFKLVRVLNLSNIGFSAPSFHGFEEVPDCVRNLKSLWYLNVSTCNLPEWIGDLICLQHLHVASVKRSISRDISKLVSLRTLRTYLPHSHSLSRHQECFLVLKDVAKLIHLQELHIGISNLGDLQRSVEGRGLDIGIRNIDDLQRSVEGGVLAKLVNMRRLTLVGPNRDVLGGPAKINFPEEMKAMKDLEYLALNGFNVPTGICEYGNLRVLKLQRCDFSQFPALETMPKLMTLKLLFCDSCRKLQGPFHNFAISE